MTIQPRRFLLTLCLFATPLISARADLIAYEPFNYLTTQTVSGADGGSGWDGAWTYSVNAYPLPSVFTNYPSTVVRRSGNMLLKLSTQTTTISRPFRFEPTLFADGSTVWFSFFLELANAPAENFNLGFVPGADAAAGIGVTVTPEAGGSLRARVSGVVSTQARALGLADTWDAGTRYFVLGRFERVQGGTDRLRIWLNPTADALVSGVLPEADLALDAELVGFPSSFRANNVARASGGGYVGYRLDEIRLATTLESACLGERTASEILLVTPPPPADGVNYYVSATAGDDANPGTSELPFRTIGRIAPFMQPGQTCVVRAGVYRETLRPALSGTAEQPITFMAAPGENVEVTGLDAVTGWTPATDAAAGTWRAVWPSPLTALQTQVFFDGAIGYQGRWPNRTNDNLMEPQGAPISTGSDATKIVATSLPASLPADTFDDGIVWVLSGKKWSSWRSPVTGFTPASKTITYQTFDGDAWPNTSHLAAAGAGNVFYVSGARKLVDTAREWYYNPANAELLIMPPTGFDPATSVVEMQTRPDAIDLSNRSYVTVKGFKVVGSDVNLSNAQHCTAEGVAISYPTAEHGPQGTNWASDRGGVMVSGSFNTVRECTVSWSWNNGIIISGTGNQMINNLVSDANLLGTYAAGLKLDQASRGTIVAWNTLERTGRDCIILNGRGNHLVHNDISGFGSICDDDGGTYSAGQGSDSLLAYNWVHDAGAATGMKAGIYLDNYTTGVTVHHNVVWNIPWVGIVLNRPSAYHVIAHNTVFQKISNYGSGGWANPRDNCIGTQVVNNLIDNTLEANSLGVTATTNLAAVADANMGFDRTTGTVIPTRSGLSAGTRIPGISQVAEGVNPDIGAFQTGVEYPTPGYDATKHPETWFDEPPSPIVQRIDNNIFFEGLDGWTPGPLGTAAIVYDSGWNYPGPESRNTIYANALSLTGDASVEQVVTDLVPGTVYSLYAFRKASASTTASTTAGLSVIFSDGREYRFTYDPDVAKKNWQLAEYFEFTVPPGQTEARVGLWMKGPGTVYFDNIGLMQKWLTPTSVDYRSSYFTMDPVDRSVIAGGSAQFTATSAAWSLRTNRWEWRPAGSVAWSPLTSSTGVTVNSTRDAPSVTLNPLRPELNGALFRAVASISTTGGDSNTFGYHAYSRPAKMTVTGVSLDHDSGRVGVDEHAYTVAVTLPAGVPWTVEGLPSWVSASATSGTGSGEVTLVVEANTSGEKREAVIRIAGRDYLVRQSDGEIFAEWVEPAEASQRGPTAEPAGDGAPNLLKYALGLDHPLDAAETSKPRLESPAENGLEFVFKRDPRRTDLHYVVRASDSLAIARTEWPIVADSEGGAPVESLDAGHVVQEIESTDGLIEVHVAAAAPAKACFYVLEVLLDDESD